MQASVVDLDALLRNLDGLEENTENFLLENSQLRKQLKNLEKHSSLLEQTKQSLLEEKTELRLSVENLQQLLTKRCDLEDENGQLKKQIMDLQKINGSLEEEHRLQMEEAMQNLKAVQEAHRKDIVQMEERSLQHMKREVESLQTALQERNCEVRYLQKQLTDAEREKHSEVVKLRLEYDAKLLKLQKENAKAQHSHNSTTSSHEIFRRKLQHAREESEREISSFKRKNEELERQLSIAKLKRMKS